MESATMESHPTMDSLATMESLAVSCRDEGEEEGGQQRRGSKLEGRGEGNGQHVGEKKMGEAKKKFVAKVTFLLKKQLAQHVKFTNLNSYCMIL